MLTKRIKNESPETRRKWDSAVRTLRKGDHYILVMLVREPVRGTRPQRVEHVAAILAAPLFYSLVLFNSRGTQNEVRRHASRNICRFLSARTEHAMQVFFVLIFVITVFRVPSPN